VIAQRAFIASLAGSPFAAPLAAGAQHATVYRVGFLS